MKENEISSVRERSIMSRRYVEGAGKGSLGPIGRGVYCESLVEGCIRGGNSYHLWSTEYHSLSISHALFHLTSLQFNEV